MSFDFITEHFIFPVGIYFWVWFIYLRFKFSNRNNWLHLIFFVISFFGWMILTAWLVEPEFKN